MKNDTSALSVPSVADEFRSVYLGDARRSRRLRIIADSWSAAPDCCVPSASKSTAKTEATYRFLNNPAITHVRIVEAHVTETCARLEAAGTAIVAHDTSEFSYQGEVRRAGLGRLRKKSDQGFLAHTALAVTADGSRCPLGVVGFAPWVRSGAARRKQANGKKRSGADYAKDKNKESARWAALVKQVSKQVGDRAALIHVMDREADNYLLFLHMVEGQHRFVIRLSKDRVVAGIEDAAVTESLKSAMGRVEGICEREVPISRRAKTTMPAAAKTFPARDARMAKLQFCAATLQIKKPKYLQDVPQWQTLNVVQVRELDVPAEVEPIEWLLVTSEPTATEMDVLAVVEFYRTRWMVEEFFKALKTGCAVEKRQHESLHALLNALAICLPIAWQMLLLRHLARSQPDAPATNALSAIHVEVLRACSPVKIDAKPTVRQALYAVAALGGHLKSNGEPGWLVLGRGMEELLTLERGWIAARRGNLRCDP